MNEGGVAQAQRPGSAQRPRHPGAAGMVPAARSTQHCEPSGGNQGGPGIARRTLRHEDWECRRAASSLKVRKDVRPMPRTVIGQDAAPANSGNRSVAGGSSLHQQAACANTNCTQACPRHYTPWPTAAAKHDDGSSTAVAALKDARPYNLPHASCTWHEQPPKPRVQRHTQPHTAIPDCSQHPPRT